MRVSIRSLMFAVGFAVLGAGCAAKRTAPQVSGERGPRMVLNCSPKNQVAPLDPRYGARVTARPRIYDPGERYWCPAVEWRINGQRVRVHEADCIPYESVPEGERQVWPPLERDETQAFPFRPGEYRIEAFFKKSGTTIGRAECFVSVQ